MLEQSAAEVHRFVAQRVFNFADAADIAQQTLLLAIAKLSTFRGENLRAWLLTIARHLIVDHFRTQQRRQFVELESAALAETEPALQTSHAAVVEACESRERIDRYLCITRRLRLEEQVALLLADVHGYRDKESAAVLCVSVPSFKLLLHGARARLKEISGGTCDLLSPTNGARTHGASAANGVNGHGCTNRQCAHSSACELVSQTSRLAPGEETPSRRRNDPSDPNGECGNHGRSTESGPCPGGVQCCLGVESCLSRNGCFGLKCRLGIKCCRQVPRLTALRDKLLEALGRFHVVAVWLWLESAVDDLSSLAVLLG